MKFLTISLIFAPFLTVFGQISSNFLYTIGKIESNNNDYAIGDGGKSISRYQIQLKCYQDATNYDKSISFSYKSLTNENNARKVVGAYLSRYCPRACKENDYQTMSRTFNGGPDGKNKTATIKYWEKFRKELTRK